MRKWFIPTIAAQGSLAPETRGRRWRWIDDDELRHERLIFARQRWSHTSGTTRRAPSPVFLGPSPCAARGRRRRRFLSRWTRRGEVEVREENRRLSPWLSVYSQGRWPDSSQRSPRSTPVTRGVLLTGDARSSVAARRGGGETLTGGSHMSAPCAWD
jgi:hypothetical protein